MAKAKSIRFTVKLPADKVEQFERQRKADHRSKMAFALIAIEEKLSRCAR